MTILQKVKRHKYVGASRYTGYVARSILLILECGHENYRKASQGVPNRARCRECEREDKIDAEIARNALRAWESIKRANLERAARGLQSTPKNVIRPHATRSSTGRTPRRRPQAGPEKSRDD